MPYRWHPGIVSYGWAIFQYPIDLSSVANVVCEQYGIPLDDQRIGHFEPWTATPCNTYYHPCGIVEFVEWRDVIDCSDSRVEMLTNKWREMFPQYDLYFEAREEWEEYGYEFEWEGYYQDYVRRHNGKMVCWMEDKEYPLIERTE